MHVTAPEPRLGKTKPGVKMLIKIKRVLFKKKNNNRADID